MHCHTVVLTALMILKPTTRVLVVVVVVGNATSPEANFAPHVMARAAVPVTRMVSVSPSLGVPVRFVVKEVIAAACAVRPYSSTLSVLMVGVADDVVVPTRFVMRLLVSVSVPAMALSVPVVGSVTFVAPVLVSVIEFVADVARVLPAPSVRVPVPVVIVLPFTDDGVIAPNVKVIAGVVVAVATVPETPFPVVTDTDETVPVGAAPPSLISFPVVPSNTARLPSVAEAGPTTSPRFRKMLLAIA